MMEKLIVGLVGPLGSGKTTIAQYLIDQGFYSLRFSSLIESEIKKRKLPLNRKVYQDIGDEWRKKFGGDYISKLLIKEIENKEEFSKFVVEGFRNPAEVEPFKKLSNFILIGLNTDPKIRFERLTKRGKPDDPKVWEDFQKQEVRDQGIGQPGHGQQVLSSLELADFVVDTDKEKEQIFKQIDNIVKEHKNELERKNSGRSEDCTFC